jgi:DNA (cytosine-5)-methyltransferase 1
MRGSRRREKQLQRERRVRADTRDNARRRAGRGVWHRPRGVQSRANAQYKPSITPEVEPNMTAKGPAGVAQPIDAEPHYIVRRLTPTECARLQGFPDWWCDDLGTPEPTDEDIAFWREVFETHRRVTGAYSKPKTDAQIAKWLKAPHSDSAEYKMWGNGVALPCVAFVLAAIAYCDEQDKMA